MTGAWRKACDKSKWRGFMEQWWSQFADYQHFYVLLGGVLFLRVVLYLAASLSDVAWWGNALVSQAFSLGIFGWWLLALPQTRVESLVCIGGAVLWIQLSNVRTMFGLAMTRQQEGRLQFERVLWTYLANLRARPSDKQLASDARALEDDVGLGDQRLEETGRLRHLLRQPSLAQYRGAIEQGWADQLVGAATVNWTDGMWIVTTAIRWSLVVVAMFRLA